MSTFSATDYINTANEREKSARDGKPPEAKPAAAEVKPADAKAAEVKSAADGDDDPKDDRHDADGHRVSRSTRRLLRQLGEAEGRAKVLEELVRGKAAVVAAGEEEDAEPKRDKFADDASYQRELGKWEARREARKTVADNEQIAAYRTELRAMDAKAMEDKKLIADYDEVAAAAIEDGPEFIPAEHPNLMGLLATSDQKAFVLYHFAKNPEELEKMLALSSRPGDQIRAFARLEGRVEKLYREDGEKKEEGGEKKEEKKAQPTAAERDAKKARPSEAVAAKGGSAPSTEVSPYNADGKTISAEWKARANERDGRR